MNSASAASHKSPVRRRGLDGLDLTLRERQVIDMIAGGLDYEEIAEKLGISPRTVKMFSARLMARFGVDRARRLPAAYWEATGASLPSAVGRAA